MRKNQDVHPVPDHENNRILSCFCVTLSCFQRAAFVDWDMWFCFSLLFLSRSSVRRTGAPTRDGAAWRGPTAAPPPPASSSDRWDTCAADSSHLETLPCVRPVPSPSCSNWTPISQTDGGDEEVKRTGERGWWGGWGWWWWWWWWGWWWRIKQGFGFCELKLKEDTKTKT